MKAERTPPTERSILSDSLETLVLRGLIFGVSLCASVVISRGLGPAGRGMYFLPVVTAGTVGGLCKLGLDPANIYLRGTRGIPVDRLAGQNGLVAMAMGLPAAAVLPLAPVLFPALFADTPEMLLLLAGLTIPFSLHTQFTAGLQTLEGAVTWQFRAALAAGIVHVSLLVMLFLTGWLSVRSVLTANLVAVTVTWAMTTWPQVRRAIPWIRWDSQLLRETLRHSLILHLGMVLYFLHFRVDMFLVKSMVGTAALGYYSLAVVLAETTLLVTESLAIAVLPRQIGNSLQDAARLALQGARANGVVAIAAGLLWTALGATLIMVFFGPDFSPAYGPLVALLPGIVFLSMERMCSGPTLRAGKSPVIAIVYAGSLACNVSLNLLLIPAWGILGASVASSISYGIEALVILAWTARLADLSFAEGVAPRHTDLVTLCRALTQGIQWVRRHLIPGGPRA